MKKKRTKKFNPNKLLPSQVKQLQQAAQYKKDISETYEMSMEFISSHVRDFIEDKKIGEKSLLDKFPHAETLPYHFTIGAYDYQDLSIALILGHVEQPEAWKLSADIHMMNLDDLSKPMVTVEFRRDLPSMSHIELLRGKKDCKIDLGHGLKKVGWLGLDQEIIKEIESQKNIPEDFGIEQIQVLIEADIKFINTKCYQEFLAVAEWVNSGHEADCINIILSLGLVPDIQNQWGKSLHQGFYCEQGKFYTRPQAALHAIECGQQEWTENDLELIALGEKKFSRMGLCSEDLW